jgi:exportin-1
MNDQFEMIYKICIQVLDNSDGVSESLVKACLKTLQAFLSWIPLQFIFDTNLMEILINKYIIPPTTRIEAIKCFTEISSLSFEEMKESPQIVQQCKERLCYYFCLLMNQIGTMTKQRSLLQEYESVA